VPRAHTQPPRAGCLLEHFSTARLSRSLLAPLIHAELISNGRSRGRVREVAPPPPGSEHSYNAPSAAEASGPPHAGQVTSAPHPAPRRRDLTTTQPGGLLFSSHTPPLPPAAPAPSPSPVPPAAPAPAPAPARGAAKPAAPPASAAQLLSDTGGNKQGAPKGGPAPVASKHQNKPAQIQPRRKDALHKQWSCDEVRRATSLLPKHVPARGRRVVVLCQHISYRVHVNRSIRTSKVFSILILNTFRKSRTIVVSIVLEKKRY
jgi:hypothetical protein